MDDVWDQRVEDSRIRVRLYAIRVLIATDDVLILDSIQPPE